MRATVSTPADALTAIHEAGVRLRLDGDRIIAAPRAAISDGVRDMIRNNRDGLAALLRPAPCPIDLAEAAAIRADAGAAPEDAELDALRTAGFKGWGGLAGRMAAEIGAALDGLPAPSSQDGRRILSATREFIRSPEFVAAVAAGWSLSALFGIGSPNEPPDNAGVVVHWALGLPGARLVAIDTSGVTFERPGGRRIWLGRFAIPDLETALPWWECAALIGEAE